MQYNFVSFIAHHVSHYLSLFSKFKQSIEPLNTIFILNVFGDQFLYIFFKIFYYFFTIKINVCRSSKNSDFVSNLKIVKDFQKN